MSGLAGWGRAPLGEGGPAKLDAALMERPRGALGAPGTASRGSSRSSARTAWSCPGGGRRWEREGPRSWMLRLWSALAVLSVLPDQHHPAVRVLQHVRHGLAQGEGAAGRGRAREVGCCAYGAPSRCSRCSRTSITRQFAFFSTYGTVLPRLNSPNRLL